MRFTEFLRRDEWQVKKLGKVCNILGGLNGKSSINFGHGCKYVTYKQVFNSSRIKLNQCELVEIREGEMQNNLQYGDILITMSSETQNEIGYVSVILDRLPLNVYLNSFCSIIRPKDISMIEPQFAFYLFKSNFVRYSIINLSQGITRINLSKSQLLKILLPIPTISEQKKIADCLSSIDEQIEAEVLSIEKLKEHKTGLMQKLFPKVV